MSVTGVTRRVAELSSAARCAEDAEASGVHTEELVADLSRAVGLLGAPDVPLAAHHGGPAIRGRGSPARDRMRGVVAAAERPAGLW